MEDTEHKETTGTEPPDSDDDEQDRPLVREQPTLFPILQQTTTNMLQLGNL